MTSTDVTRSTRWLVNRRSVWCGRSLARRPSSMCAKRIAVYRRCSGGPTTIGARSGSDELAPACDRVVRIVAHRVRQDRHLVGLDRAARPVHQLGGDAQVAAAAVVVVQLGDEREHERRREGADVLDAVRLVLVEQRVAARVDLPAMLVEDRAQQALTIAEVVLQRRRVALTGLTVDLPQRHAVDATVGEELLGGADERRRCTRAAHAGRPRHRGDHTERRLPMADRAPQ